MTTERDELAGSDRCATCGAPSDGRLLCDRCRGGGYTVGTPHPTTAPPERLERRAHLCGVIDEAGEPCKTYTLHAACQRHRRQAAGGGDDVDGL